MAACARGTRRGSGALRPRDSRVRCQRDLRCPGGHRKDRFRHGHRAGRRRRSGPRYGRSRHGRGRPAHVRGVPRSLLRGWGRPGSHSRDGHGTQHQPPGHLVEPEQYLRRQLRLLRPSRRRRGPVGGRGAARHARDRNDRGQRHGGTTLCGHGAHGGAHPIRQGAQPPGERELHLHPTRHGLSGRADRVSRGRMVVRAGQTAHREHELVRYGSRVGREGRDGAQA